MDGEQQQQQEQPIEEPPSLYDKIMVLYPDLTFDDFRIDKNAYIILRDDGEGTYIYLWNHPSYIQPSQQELDSGVLAFP